MEFNKDTTEKPQSKFPRRKFIQALALAVASPFIKGSSEQNNNSKSNTSENFDSEKFETLSEVIGNLKLDEIIVLIDNSCPINIKVLENYILEVVRSSGRSVSQDSWFMGWNPKLEKNYFYNYSGEKALTTKQLDQIIAKGDSTINEFGKEITIDEHKYVREVGVFNIPEFATLPVINPLILNIRATGQESGVKGMFYDGNGGYVQLVLPDISNSILCIQPSIIG